MDHSVPHDVGRELAKKATLAAFDSYATKYSEYEPRATWISDYTAKVAMHIKGMSLDGTIDVRDRDIALTLDVPFVLRPFRAKALAVIEREISAWLVRARAGEFT